MAAPSPSESHEFRLRSARYQDQNGIVFGRRGGASPFPVGLLEIWVKIDYFVLLLPIRRARLEWHIDCHRGGSVFVEYVLDGVAVLFDRVGDRHILRQIVALHGDLIPESRHRNTRQ